MLGRFGIALERAENIIVNNKTFDRISLMHNIVSYFELPNNEKFVAYIPQLDADIINNHNLDWNKVGKVFRDNELSAGYNIGSIPISAAVTSYVRIHI